MAALVDARRDNPSDDLISKLVHEQLIPGNLTKEDVVAIAFLLLVAGNATMVNMIALGVVTLLQHPLQLEDLKKDPSLAGNFVEELCRYHTAAGLQMRRVAKEELELGGRVRVPFSLNFLLTSILYLIFGYAIKGICWSDSF